MANDPKSLAGNVFTVGHSNHDLPHLVQLLQDASVAEVADVRSAPYSGRYPQFNQEELQEGLKEHGIGYAFFGESLGGRPRQSGVYDREGRVDYERVRKTDSFQEGLDLLCRRAAERSVCLLCAEEDPLDCHRGLMIAPVLVERGLSPVHLRGDGRVETTAEMEERLLATTDVGAELFQGLFAATLPDDERRHLLLEAYRARSKKAAFRLRSIPGELREDDFPDEKDDP